MALTRAPGDRLRAVEPTAFAGVFTRETTLFRRVWRSTTFGSIVEPTINLVAFGFGFGALVASVQGIPYVQYIGTGVVASAVLFSSVFAGMFDTYVKRFYMKTYDGILATPVDVPELFLAEAAWIAVKSGIYGCAPLLVCVELVRDAVFGWDLPAGLGHVLALGVFAAVMGVLAVRVLRRRLID